MKQLNEIQIFVINLEKRNDRLEQVSEMLKDLKWERIEAIASDKGYYGCVLSHIKALTLAKKRDLPEVIIMEDDFHFVPENGNNKFIYPDEEPCQECDVCLYSCHLKDKSEYSENFYKVNEAQRTDFYLVKKHYYDKLISVFMSSLINLLNNYERKYYLDIYWKNAQQQDLFLCAKKRLGHQRNGFSDIQNKEINRRTRLN